MLFPTAQAGSKLIPLKLPGLLRTREVNVDAETVPDYPPAYSPSSGAASAYRNKEPYLPQLTTPRYYGDYDHGPRYYNNDNLSYDLYGYKQFSTKLHIRLLGVQLDRKEVYSCIRRILDELQSAERALMHHKEIVASGGKAAVTEMAEEERLTWEVQYSAKRFERVMWEAERKCIPVDVVEVIGD